MKIFFDAVSGTGMKHVSVASLEVAAASAHAATAAAVAVDWRPAAERLRSASHASVIESRYRTRLR